MSRKTIFTGAPIVMVLALVLAACATGKTQEATSAAPSTPAVAKTIKFAVAGPMSGDVADFGNIQLQGVKQAVKEINDAGGINGMQIVLDVYDDKCDSTEAASVASKVVSDPTVFAVIGHMCSGATLAAAPIYEKAGLTYLTASSSRTDLTQHGYKHLFRTITHDAGYGPILADVALKHLCSKRIAIFYATDDYGIGLLKTTEAAIKERGGNIVLEETYRAGDKDFSPQLAKAAESKADVIMLITEYTEGALIARQRAAAGLGNVPIVAASTMQFPEFIKLGGQYVEGAIVGAAWDRYSTIPSVKAFNDKWTELYSEPANELNSYYYDAVFIMKAAIEKGATRDTLSDVLRTIRYEGPTGVTEFDANGEVKPKQLYALQIKNGQFTSYDLTKPASCQ